MEGIANQLLQFRGHLLGYTSWNGQEPAINIPLMVQIDGSGHLMTTFVSNQSFGAPHIWSRIGEQISHKAVDMLVKTAKNGL
eukprot:2039123-Pyramimonas_sp.AAC.1